jgi:hypothetical protein
MKLSHTDETKGAVAAKAGTIWKGFEFVLPEPGKSLGDRPYGFGKTSEPLSWLGANPRIWLTVQLTKPFI